MNRFRPMPASQPPRVDNVLRRAWNALCSTLLDWFHREAPTSLRMGRSPAVLICYHCRCRVTAEEIAAGLHDHPKSASAAAGSQAGEQ